MARVDGSDMRVTRFPLCCLQPGAIVLFSMIRSTHKPYKKGCPRYLFMEFHKEWESFKQGLVDKYCQELKNNFGSCLRVAEERLQELVEDHTLEGWEMS